MIVTSDQLREWDACEEQLLAAARFEEYADELSTPHQVWASVAFVVLIASFVIALWAVLP